MLLRYRIDHLLFWAFTIFFHAYTRLFLIPQAGWYHFLLEVIIRNSLLAGSIYLVLGYAVPALTQARQWKALAVVLLTIALYVLSKTTHDAYLYQQVLHDFSVTWMDWAFYNFSIVLFYLAFASTLYLSKQWYLQREKMRKLEVEQLQTELQYLRAQMNPHFLFNSINTIYFQIDKQNNVARETLEKFSDMLRYQLYECADSEVAIEKEIHYLTNYIQLQKLRLNESYSVQVQIEDGLKNFSIPPLLLLPFIENAFKHVSHHQQKPNEIEVVISRNETHLLFSIRNTIENLPKADVGGIGLKNVTRRLDLIYDRDYALKTHVHEERFVVKLEVPIR